MKRATLGQLLVSALIAGLFIFLYIGELDKATYWLFQERDLLRAKKLLQGQLIFFGPEATGGGNLPGGLYYWLLALGQTFGSLLMGPWFLNVLFFAFSLGGIYFYFSRKLGVAFGFAGIGIFFGLPSTMALLFTFLNVSYLPFFCVFAVMAGVVSFSKVDKHQGKWWCLSCFLVGLGVQLHFSILIVLLAGFWLQFVAPPERIARMSRRIFSLGLLAFFLPLLPYLTWSMFRFAGVEFSQSPPLYVGSIIRAVPSLFRIIFSSTHGGFENVSSQLVAGIFSGIPVFLLIIFIIELAFKFFLNAAPILHSIESKVSWYYLVICALPMSYGLFAPIGRRYVLPFSVAALFFILFYIADLHRHRDNKKLRVLNYTSALIITIGLLMLFKLVVVEKNNLSFFSSQSPLLTATAVAAFFGIPALMWKNSSQSLWLSLSFCVGTSLLASTTLIYSNSGSRKSRMPSIGQFRAIAERIHSETSWSEDEVRQRVLFVNPHMEQYFPTIYKETIKDKEQVVVPTENRPNGYIVTKRVVPKGKRGKSFSEWLKEQAIPLEIKSALDKGSLQITSTALVRGLVLASYKINDTNDMPPFFHNIGFPYEEYHKHKLFKPLVKSSVGVVPTESDQYLFYWNLSPYRAVEFMTGAIVQVDKKKDHVSLDIEVIGTPISQPSPWVTILWTEAWQESFVNIVCDKKAHRFQLAYAIGNHPDFMVNFTTMAGGNNSFLAPFRRHLQTTCKGKLKEVSIGRKFSVVGDTIDYKKIPAEPVTLKF